MKRIVRIVIVIVILFCCGCSKKFLTCPEYPLSEEDLNTILKEENLEWTITRKDSVQDDHFTYTLSDHDEKMICMISTAKGNEESRYLQIVFFTSPTNISTVLPSENWDNAITLAQVLYGNFQSKTQINDALTHVQRDELIIHDIKNPSSESSYKKIQWKESLNDINCIITFIQFPDEEDRLSLETIVLYDSNEFMLQKKFN